MITLSSVDFPPFGPMIGSCPPHLQVDVGKRPQATEVLLNVGVKDDVGLCMAFVSYSAACGVRCCRRILSAEAATP